MPKRRNLALAWLQAVPGPFMFTLLVVALEVLVTASLRRTERRFGHPRRLDAGTVFVLISGMADG